MNLLYVVWGNDVILHQQCVFSLLTALNIKNTFEGYYVMTDNPQYYKLLEENITIIPIDATHIDKWSGETKFILNVKIKGIEYFNELYPNKNVLFVDADTCFGVSLLRIKEGLENGEFFLHTREWSFKEKISKSKRTKRIYKKIKGFTSAELKLNRRITDETIMYNSGVIGLPAGANRKRILREVYELTNLFLTKGNLKAHSLEQLAFSLVLSEQETLKTCEDEIIHYWGNKDEWSDKISNFIVNAFLKDLSIKETISLTQKFDFNLPVICRVRSINRKLKTLVCKLYPNKYSY